MSLSLRYRAYAAMMLIVLSMIVPSASSFSVSMQEYRPPVKTSVKKLHSDLSSASRTSTRTATHSRSSGNIYDKQKFIQQHHQPTSLNRRSRFASSSTSKSAHAAGIVYPSSESTSVVNTFERRMRELVLGAQRREQKQQTQESQSYNLHQQNTIETTASSITEELEETTTIRIPSTVQTIQTVEQFKAIVGDEREKVVIVRFFAAYCRACKAVAPHFYKMAQDNSNSAIFVDVPVTARTLHQGLGIPSLPYVHIYHPERGLVEEMSFTRKHVSDVSDKLKTYIEECK